MKQPVFNGNQWNVIRFFFLAQMIDSGNPWEPTFPLFLRVIT